MKHENETMKNVNKTFMVYGYGRDWLLETIMVSVDLYL